MLSCGWSRHAHFEHGLAFCLRERVECPVTCANTPASCYGSIARKQVSHGVGPGRSQCGQREQTVLPVPELSELASAVAGWFCTSSTNSVNYGSEPHAQPSGITYVAHGCQRTPACATSGQNKCFATRASTGNISSKPAINNSSQRRAASVRADPRCISWPWTRDGCAAAAAQQSNVRSAPLHCPGDASRSWRVWTACAGGHTEVLKRQLCCL